MQGSRMRGVYGLARLFVSCRDAYGSEKSHTLRGSIQLCGAFSMAFLPQPLAGSVTLAGLETGSNPCVFLPALQLRAESEILLGPVSESLLRFVQ